MPLDENPQARDIPNPDSETAKEQENIKFQARMATRHYENMNVQEQIQRAKEKDTLGAYDLDLANYIDHVYAELKELESKDDFKVNLMKVKVKNFNRMLTKFNEAVRSKETDSDREKIPSIAKKALSMYEKHKENRSQAGKEARTIYNSLRVVSTDSEATLLQVEVLTEQLTELCKKLSSTARDMQRDKDDVHRAEAAIDEYIESKEVEDAQSTRCVARLYPKHMWRIDVPGGDVLEIYEEEETVEIPITEMNEKYAFAEVKIPEKYKKRLRRNYDIGTIQLDKANLVYVEVSVKDVQRIEQMLHERSEILRSVRDEDSVDWDFFKEMYENNMQKIIGSSASQILTEATQKPYFTGWYNVEPRESIFRCTGGEISNKIDLIEDMKKELMAIMNNRDSHDTVYINAYGKIVD